jgi:hypothetical protein
MVATSAALSSGDDTAARSGARDSRCRFSNWTALAISAQSLQDTRSSRHGVYQVGAIFRVCNLRGISRLQTIFDYTEPMALHSK